MRTLALLAILLAPVLRADDNVRVAVAANFKPTLLHLSEQFQSDTGIAVTLSSASTGALAAQIIHGAPFDVFFAADSTTPDQLYATEKDWLPPFCYAIGRLALVGASDFSALADPGLSLAIANPVTAPYGAAAMEVLDRVEFSAGKTRKLVRGNNAIQAYQFWYSGAVDLALVPKSLATDPGAIAVPKAWHTSLAQFALIRQQDPAVDAYLKWMRSDTVRDQITQAGYDSCP